MSEEKKDEVLDQEKELDTNELNEVAGGDPCICIVGGGGTGDEDEKTCACVVGGGGEWKEPDDNGIKARCACPVYGWGDCK